MLCVRIKNCLDNLVQSCLGVSPLETTIVNTTLQSICCFGIVEFVVVYLNDSEGQRKHHFFPDYQERDTMNGHRIRELERDLSGEFK